MDDPFPSVSNFVNRSNMIRIINQTAADPTVDHSKVKDMANEESLKPNFIVSLMAGATAGTVVDITLYPLDTIKTRLQSQQGIRASGGFRGVYQGIGPVILGSAPSSAIFFASYNGLINYMKKEHKTLSDNWINFIAASMSEIISATVRVPIEVIKQRKQISLNKTTSLDIVKRTINTEGVSGLYRGFASTIMREIPFAGIQFPLWEYFKKKVTIRKERPTTTFETAYCGAAAGCITAAITTPMDVIKTRTMLASNDLAHVYGRLISFYIARDIILERGIHGLFAGVIPRVLWITIGGFIYFGMYEFMNKICQAYLYPVQLPRCVRDVIKLKEKEKEKLLLAQSAPTYSDEVGNDDIDYYNYDESEGDEMDYSESLELTARLINP